ncbi:hypothetical protein DQE80_16995, partial [Enterococcus sp. HPCN18]
VADAVRRRGRAADRGGDAPPPVRRARRGDAGVDRRKLAGGGRRAAGHRRDGGDAVIADRDQPVRIIVARRHPGGLPRHRG